MQMSEAALKQKKIEKAKNLFEKLKPISPSTKSSCGYFFGIKDLKKIRVPPQREYRMIYLLNSDKLRYDEFYSKAIDLIREICENKFKKGQKQQEFEVRGTGHIAIFIFTHAIQTKFLQEFLQSFPILIKLDTLSADCFSCQDFLSTKGLQKEEPAEMTPIIDQRISGYLPITVMGSNDRFTFRILIKRVSQIPSVDNFCLILEQLLQHSSSSEAQNLEDKVNQIFQRRIINPELNCSEEDSIQRKFLKTNSESRASIQKQERNNAFLNEPQSKNGQMKALFENRMKNSDIGGNQFQQSMEKYIVQKNSIVPPATQTHVVSQIVVKQEQAQLENNVNNMSDLSEITTSNSPENYLSSEMKGKLCSVLQSKPAEKSQKNMGEKSLSYFDLEAEAKQS